MTVEINEDKIKTISWQGYGAIFTNGELTKFLFSPSLEQVKAEPEEFADFAIAFRDTLLASKPPEPKKPRKVRKDKGISKKVSPEVLNPTRLEIKVGKDNEPHEARYGDSEGYGFSIKNALIALRDGLGGWPKDMDPRDLYQINAIMESEFVEEKGKK